VMFVGVWIGVSSHEQVHAHERMPAGHP